MKISKLSIVLEKQDFREWATQFLRSAVPDSVSIASVALNGTTIVVKGRAEVLFVKHDFKMEFEMSPAKDGAALFLKLKNANPLMNGILKAVFPDVAGVEYSWCDEGISISINRLLRPMGISIARLTGVADDHGSACLDFGKAA